MGSDPWWDRLLRRIAWARQPSQKSSGSSGTRARKLSFGEDTFPLKQQTLSASLDEQSDLPGGRGGEGRSRSYSTYSEGDAVTIAGGDADRASARRRIRSNSM